MLEAFINCKKQGRNPYFNVSVRKSHRKEGEFLFGVAAFQIRFTCGLVKVVISARGVIFGPQMAIGSLFADLTLSRNMHSSRTMHCLLRDIDRKAGFASGVEVSAWCQELITEQPLSSQTRPDVQEAC